MEAPTIGCFGTPTREARPLEARAGAVAEAEAPAEQMMRLLRPIALQIFRMSMLFPTISKVA